MLDWLAPLLEESPAWRLQSAADALQRLDRPWPPAGAAPLPGAGPASPRLEPLVAPPGPLRKAVLLRTLADTYGPVVELLLESCPSLLPREEVEPLRQRLVGAGLARVDVDQACRAAVNPAPAEPTESAPLAAAVSPPAAVLSSVAPSAADAGAAEDQALLEILRRCIGPIADLLWSDELRLALGRDASEARGPLLASAVPPQAVEEFLSLARAATSQGAPVPTPAAAEPPPASPSAPLPAPPQPAAPQDPSPQPPPFEEKTLREVVLTTLGPIGETLLQAHADLPLRQRWQMLLGELQTYGVDPEVVAELQKRLRQG